MVVSQKVRFFFFTFGDTVTRPVFTVYFEPRHGDPRVRRLSWSWGMGESEEDCWTFDENIQLPSIRREEPSFSGDEVSRFGDGDV